jgi:dienelactone hydrolase
VIYIPRGRGPFPSVLYNHGSYRDPAIVAEKLGPLFASKGWVFFMPYRRGHGPSPGPYVSDLIDAAEKRDGVEGAAQKMMELLEGDHFNDQRAAFEWLQAQSFVDRKRIAVQGNSFGGIEALIGAGRLPYCAAVNAAGGSTSWDASPIIPIHLHRLAGEVRVPILFFQAQNDFSLRPSIDLSQTAAQHGADALVKIFPAFGTTPADGHSFAYLGSEIWGDDVLGFLNNNCLS